ncbi:ABC transporter ATP-binding protein [Nocardia wallacei]|uniref:ABC transporter ATP-binding protein n=1 Tax=Nocardia wallacei TaxID=480035 RepID=UPI002457E24B|nr:ABC transporter ATP-binding protein [Nocardia wallacei]
MNDSVHDSEGPAVAAVPARATQVGDDGHAVPTSAPAPAAAVVVTEALTKRYGAHTAVDAVRMTVRAGEIYGFLGPNGAGKTTTLRMLVGLIRPTSGTATVLGRRPGDPEALRRTGVLIEGPGFYPYLSGRDNLRVLARYRGTADGSGRTRSTRALHDDVEQVLRRVGLADRAGDKFRAYSLGMKQRLGVAAALLGHPDLLILDEPTNGLDPAGMAEMRELITGLAADGHTVVLSSHLLTEVQEICDRVGVISRGRLLTEATVGELRGAATLFLRAEPVELAFPAVRRVVGDRSALLTAAGIRVAAGTATAPVVARAVIEAGADLLELRSDEKSLEEVFFEMTKLETA